MNPLGLELLSQSCNTPPCPVYVWQFSTSWSNCSVSCGGGEQYALVQCFNIALDTDGSGRGTIVQDQYCTQARPLGTRPCATDTCPDYHFRTGAWSACSDECGGGSMQRVVSCHNMQGVRMADCTLNSCPDVDETFCIAKGLTKPPSSAPCNQQSCVGNMWWADDWGDCSSSCGGTGVQTRAVNCIDSGTFIPATDGDAACKDIEEKPASSQPCNTYPCNEYQWLPLSWTTCSVVCDGGTRTRSLACLFGGITVDNSLCTANVNAQTLPMTTGNCNTQSCATFWWTSDFGPCSKTCEYGVATRTVECRSSTTTEGVKVSDDQCTATRPTNSAVCNAFPCPAWVTSDWSACSVRCGDGGIRTRTVVCLSYDNLIVPDTLCVHNMPSVSEPCTEDDEVNTAATASSSSSSITSNSAKVTPCPHWHRSDWGDCSRTCGGGVQNRTLVCRLPHDNVWQGRIADDWSLCPAGYAGADSGPLIDTGDGSTSGAPGTGADQAVPVLSRPCNTNPCNDYYWHVTWGPCSASCNGGVQQSTVECVSNVNGQVVSNNLCLDIPPPMQRICGTPPCSSYEWFNLTDWSSCSVQCGIGVQTRHIRCRDANPRPDLNLPWGEMVADSICEAAGLPKLPSTRECSWPNWQCYGLGSGNAAKLASYKTRLNGRCDMPIGSCICREGYGPGGSDCNVTPTLSKVATNALQYSASGGIPLGEPLQLTWTASLYVDYVALALVNEKIGMTAEDASGVRHPLAFPQLFVSRLLNNGTFIWRVGSGLPFGVGRGGSGFRIRVLFNKDVWADSEEITLANPCGYTSCGKQGGCINNGECECNAGWSGLQCEKGPCDSLGCNLLHSKCIGGSSLDPSASGLVTPAMRNASLDGNAYCQCTDGWTGPQCATPPSCPSSCAHGADWAISGIILSDGSGASTSTPCPTICACTNGWDSTTDCTTCALPCQNGGNPSTVQGDGCEVCECSAGFFGSECQCSYYLLTFRLSFTPTIISSIGPALYATDTWVSDQIVLAQLEATLSRDWASAIGLPRTDLLSVSIVSANNTSQDDGKAILTVKIAKQCTERQYHQHGSNIRTDINQLNTLPAQSSAAYRALLVASQSYIPHRNLFQASSGGVSLSSNSSLAIRVNTSFDSAGRPLADPNANLPMLWSVLSAHFTDLSSPLYNGLISCFIDTTYPMRVSDPSGRTHPVNPSTPADPFSLTPPSDSRADGSTAVMGNTIIIVVCVIGGLAMLLCVVAVAVRAVTVKRGLHRVDISHSPTSDIDGEWRVGTGRTRKGHFAVPTEGSPSPEPIRISDKDLAELSHDIKGEISIPSISNSKAIRAAPPHVHTKEGELSNGSVGIGLLSGVDGVTRYSQILKGSLDGTSPWSSRYTNTNTNTSTNTSGTSTPAIGLSNANSRRTSDADNIHQSTQHTPTILHRADAVPRGSIIQHIRIAKPQNTIAPIAISNIHLTSAANTTVASPSPSPDNSPLSSHTPMVCASPTALIQTDVLNQIFDEADRR
jgi:hypothetical protein